MGYNLPWNRTPKTAHENLPHAVASNQDECFELRAPSVCRHMPPQLDISLTDSLLNRDVPPVQG